MAIIPLCPLKNAATGASITVVDYNAQFPSIGPIGVDAETIGAAAAENPFWGILVP